VTGAPAGSIVFVDGVQNGQMAESNGKPQVLGVASGEHIVEVRTGDTVVYREQTFVGPGEKRVVKVLSGTGRE
jgi:RNA-splicing ligase RtcB